MTSEEKTKSIEFDLDTDYLLEIPFKEILKNQVRHEIFFLLSIYGELNLTDLSKLLAKSKPALHRHIQNLLKVGLIYESKEEKVRGSIKAKFYQLIPSIRQLYQPFDTTALLNVDDPEQRIKMFKKLIHFERAKYFISKASLDLLAKYIDQFEKQLTSSNLDVDKEFILTCCSPFNMFIFSDDSLKLLQDLFSEFDRKKKTIEEEYETKHGEPSMKQNLMVFTMTPIQRLLEFKRKLPSPREERMRTLLGRE